MTTRVLYIDDREPEQLRLFAAEAVKPNPSKVQRLWSGDYMMLDKDGCALAIERKTWGDFLGSVGDGRVFNQLVRMREHYHYSVLVLEGPLIVTREGETVKNILTGREQKALGGRMLLAGRESTFTHALMQMTLFSIQRALPVAVLYTSGHEETADLIRIMYDRGQRECYGISTNRRLSGAPTTVQRRPRNS